MFSRCLVCMAAAFVLSWAWSGARGAGSADYLRLKDGREFEGEVVKEEPNQIHFRTSAVGIATTLVVRRSEIVVLEVTDEDDAASVALEPPASADPESGPEPSEAIMPETEEDERPLVVFIPVRGTIGGLNEAQLTTGTYDAALIDDLLKTAYKKKAAFVVLDIDSPGGEVAEMERICELLRAWQGHIPIAAFPADAYSAAAVVALSCKHLVVRSTSVVGSTVVVRDAPTGIEALDPSSSAYDAKLHSAILAKQRSYFAAAGRPDVLVDAMGVPAAELWWSPTHGLSAATVADAADCRRVEGPDSVLTMTADQLIEWRIALGTADSRPEVARLLLPGADCRIVDYGRAVEAYWKKSDRLIVAFQTGLEAYHQSLFRLYALLANTSGLYHRRDAVRDEIEVAKRHHSQIRRLDWALFKQRINVSPDLMLHIAGDDSWLDEIDGYMTALTQEKAIMAQGTIWAILELWREENGSDQ